MAIDVRPLQKADVRDASRVLGRAFYEDPIMTWMLPKTAQRAKSLPRMFAAMTRHHFLSGGGAEVAVNDSGIGSAALWDAPGRWKHSGREELGMMPTLIWAFRSRVSAARQVMEIMKREHPEEPHWYLAVIGSDPWCAAADSVRR